jgi:ATP-dependent Lon protease
MKSTSSARTFAAIRRAPCSRSFDPRQNHAFVDHYLDVPFDLSQVIFIATANYFGNVPPPLRDRMETIEIPGYTDREKLEIARAYLVRRQLAENGLKREQCKWSPTALSKVIEDYTREAGVPGTRTPDRQRLSRRCRAGGSRRTHRGEVTPQLVQEIPRTGKVHSRNSTQDQRARRSHRPRYTPVGGEVLHIEGHALCRQGRGHAHRARSAM